MTTASAKQHEHWLKPEPGWFKVNTDGAFHTAEESGGGGVVIRDHDGVCVRAANHFFPHLLDADCAELQACRLGLTLAADL